MSTVDSLVNNSVTMQSLAMHPDRMDYSMSTMAMYQVTYGMATFVQVNLVNQDSSLVTNRKRPMRLMVKNLDHRVSFHFELQKKIHKKLNS